MGRVGICQAIRKPTQEPGMLGVQMNRSSISIAIFSFNEIVCKNINALAINLQINWRGIKNFDNKKTSVQRQNVNFVNLKKN